MAEHGSSRIPRGASATPYDATITDIIPFNEFGDLDELDFGNTSAFDRESLVIRAPELDDTHDTDDMVSMRLAVPARFRPEDERTLARAYRASHTDVSDGMQNTDVIDMSGRRGLHRRVDGGAVKGRLVAAAMAVGATAAAAYSVTEAAEPPSPEMLLAAGPNAFVDGAVITGSVDGMQIVSVAPAASAAVHSEEFANGTAFAAERAEREARLARPTYVMPTRGVWTSGFGYRWGVLHGGIDIANAIGTPVLAAADGVVINADGGSGYGNMLKLRHRDGTVTLYGHLNTKLVSVGERVWAGDQIATMGNTGNSTGPHLHFEVLVGGSARVDPTSWLAQRGVSGPGKFVG